MGLFSRKTEMVREADALPGRSTPLRVPETHFVNGQRIQPPFAPGLEQAVFGLGCFWGAERLFWRTAGRLGRPPSATPAASRRTRPTKRSARAVPGTPKSCWSSMTRLALLTRHC